MKKLNVLVLGLLFTLVVKGQSKKISIGVVGSPDFYNYNFYRILGSDHQFKTKINYSMGLRLQYSFNEKISMKTGVMYSTKGYIIQYRWVMIDPNDPMVPEESDVKISYIDIPLLINFNLLNRNKISLFPSVGIVTSVLPGKKEVSVMTDGSKKETDIYKFQKLNSVLVAFEMNLGLRYNFNEKLFLTFEPYLRLSINKFDDAVLVSNPTSFGTIAGFHYNLN